MSTPVYCSIAEIKNSLNITGTELDVDLTNAVAAASRAIDEFTGRRFYPDASASARKFWPVNPGFCVIDDCYSFTSLVAQESTWTQDADFFLEPLNAPDDGRPYTAIRTIARPFIFTLSERSAGWAGFDGRVTVTGKWGWAAVPDPIAEATRLLAIRYMKRMREAPLGVISFGMDVPAGRVAAIDPDVRALIAPYQLAVLA